MADVRSSQQLAHGAIGLREVLFQSITHMAPAAAVAFSIIVGAPFAAGALPLSVLLALVACLFVAVSMGELARYLPSAGGFFTYATRGLHPTVGFLVAWGYTLAEGLGAPLLYLIFGNVVAGTLQAELGWSYAVWWPVAAVFAALLVFVIGYRGITVSTEAGTVLGVFEIVVFAVLGVWLVVAAGGDNTLAVFGTGYATAEGFGGLGGVVAGSIYCILAFIGFEAAAPLAEEAKDPRRTVRIAIVGSALSIGVFYLVTTYGAAVWFGPERFAEFTAFGDGNPWQEVARQVWAAGWVLVFLAVVNSAIANANAAANAATRTWFALGRIRLLPAVLATVHPRWRSPHVAITVQFVFAVVVALALGWRYEPLGAFSLIATMFTTVLILIYITVNLACIGFYWRFQRAAFNWFQHLVLPVLGVVAFMPALLTALGIEAFPFVSALTPPLSYAGPVVVAWLLIGLAYLLWLSRRHPQRLAETGRVFLDAEPSPARPATQAEP